MKDEHLSQILMSSRYQANKSQEYMSERLDVSRKTIQHWEKGISEPTVSQIFKWFQALGQNPVPYLFRYAHKGDFDNIEDLKAIDRAFESLSRDLTAEDKLSILFIYNGEHGSSPSSIIQLIIAHLHNPLRDRIPVATSIVTTYKMNKMTGKIICGEYPLPNLKMLKNAIDSAIDSVGNCVEGYTNRL